MEAIAEAGIFDFNPLLSMVVEEVLNQGALAVIILAIAAIAIMASRPTFMKPGGRSRTQGFSKTSALNCANCREPMEKLEEESVQPYLSQTEQVAQKIGSLSFEGWRCPRCQPKLTRQDIHVHAYVLDRFRYGICPSCQEWTVERTRQILELATKDKEGERLVTEKCHCCSYLNEKLEVIHRKMSDESSSSVSGAESWGDDGGDGGDSWSGDSGSVGSGDSGCGGDGGGW